MNALDIVLVIVIAAFIAYGAVKGLVRLLLGSVAIALGVFLGCWYHVPVGAAISGLIKEEHVRAFVAFGAVFVSTLLAFGILVWFITRTLDAAHLRWVDRVSGALLGLAMAALLVGAALVPITAFLPADSTLVGRSRISPYISHISSFVKSIVPEGLKVRYEEARARMAAAGRGVLPGGGDVPLPPVLPEVVKGIGKLKPQAGTRSKAGDPNG